MEIMEPHDITYDNDTDLYTSIYIFKLRGGPVSKNPLQVYCQVANFLPPSLLPYLIQTPLSYTLPPLLPLNFLPFSPSISLPHSLSLPPSHPHPHHHLLSLILSLSL